MTFHNSGRRRAAILALTATTALLIAPAVAHAASSTTCLGSSTITYSPGLTNTAQTVTYTETDTLTPCVSTNPALNSGGFTGSITLPGASCLAVPSLTLNTPYTITWNNGAPSTVNLSFTDAIAEGIEQVTGTGTVTSGQFQGANATLVWVYLVPDPLQCLANPGVTTQVGTLTAQVTGI
ncbi:MAG TPA: hypothetical protein VH352_02480 [Pseudonocardiaceae bacterium]|jgi:methionine-rich copper-binding protein CopC|nr:hypothetical protein [Pseudonocardiaceae bacterium]